MEQVTAGLGVHREERSETCPQHGEFTARKLSFGGKDYGWTTCLKCEHEKNEAEHKLEVQRHREAVIFRCMADADIPVRFKTKTLENFEVLDEDQRIGLASARSYVTDFPANLKAGRGLVLCGTTGRGKTHLGCGIARALAETGRHVRYTTARDLIRALRDTWRRDSLTTETELLSQLRDLDLLVLDEVGVQFGSDAERVQLFDVINGRYGAQRPTLVISNLDLAGLRENLGERVVDRLRENDGRALVFTGKSWRAR
jgi:DNA replication protein DnaC